MADDQFAHADFGRAMSMRSTRGSACTHMELANAMMQREQRTRAVIVSALVEPVRYTQTSSTPYVTAVPIANGTILIAREQSTQRREPRLSFRERQMRFHGLDHTMVRSGFHSRALWLPFRPLHAAVHAQP